MTAEILVADDDEEMRELLAFNLSAYEVTTLDDGQAAWDYLEDHGDDPPDLIILDVMMPGLSGYRVLERIQDDPRFAEVPVVMLTSRATEDDVVRGLESGAAEYVTKPYSSDELVTRIERLLP